MFWQRDTRQQDISRAISFILAIADGYKFCTLASRGGSWSRTEFQSFKTGELDLISKWLSDQKDRNRRVYVLTHKVGRWLDFVEPSPLDFEGTKWIAYRFPGATEAEVREFGPPFPTTIVQAKDGIYAGLKVEREWKPRQVDQILRGRARYTLNVDEKAESTDWLPVPFFGAELLMWHSGNIHDHSAFPEAREKAPDPERDEMARAQEMYAPIVRPAPAQMEQYHRAPQFDTGVMDYEAPRGALRGAPSGNAVMLGNGERGAIHWAPFETENKLLNFGVLVTGDPGSGKTQTLNVLINGVARMGLPITVFDFKNDYSDREFCQENKLRVHDVRRHGLPFNPLMPSSVDGGQVQPIEHIFNIVGVLKRVFGLGDRQAAALRDATKEAFARNGINPQKWLDADSISPPSFNEVIGILEEQADAKNSQASALLDRISPLFDLGLFPASKGRSASFEALLDDRVVLSLFALPNDEIKAALAEMIIIRMHAVLLSRPQPRKLSRLIVADEAWRIASSKHLENLAREGRAFGCGIAIGTQFPGDLPPDFAGALDTKVFLKNAQSDHRRAVAKALCGVSGSADANSMMSTLERLRQFEGVIQNTQYAPFVKFRLVPYFERENRNVPGTISTHAYASDHDEDREPAPRRQPREPKLGKVDPETWLLDQLRAAGGSLPMATLRAAGDKDDISWPRLDKAIKELKLNVDHVEGRVNNGKIVALN